MKGDKHDYLEFPTVGGGKCSQNLLKKVGTFADMCWQMFPKWEHLPTLVKIWEHLPTLAEFRPTKAQNMKRNKFS